MVILGTYYYRYYNGKRTPKLPFRDKEPLFKRVMVHIGIWTLIPLAMPVFLLYLIWKIIDNRRYKNKPRPVPSNQRGFMKADVVFDEHNKSMSLAEYNYKHGATFTLDQVYGKGYEASLKEDDKKSIIDENSRYGTLKYNDNLLGTPHTTAATIFGDAMLSGNFIAFESIMEENIETVLYGSRTITGKQLVLDYWKTWRTKYVETKEVTEFEVKHSHYYSNTCLQMDNMLVLFMMNGLKIARMILVSRHISGGYYTHHDDLIEDYPFNINFIRRYTKPLREANEFNPLVKTENRLPCFCCGTRSESLDWYSTQINCGIHGYNGIVSICPTCGKIVEYMTEIRYRMDAPVTDEYDALDAYVSCWNDLTVWNFDAYLSEDFRYSSTWVMEELGKYDYIEYFASKLRKIADSGSSVRARLIDKLIVVTQDGNNVVIKVRFENGKISRADMSPASLYGIPEKEEVDAPKFKMMGLINYSNSCPLKRTKYIDKIPSDVVIRMFDYDKVRQGDNNPYSTRSLRQIAEDCDWLYIGELARTDSQSLQLLKGCYQDAIEDGIYEAANNLGIIALNYEDNAIEADKWLSWAVSKGSQNAMINQFTNLWTNERYEEGVEMLKNMRFAKNPSLRCLWNLAYLYYMGDNCPNNTIVENQHEAKSVLSIIADYNGEMVCEQEVNMPDRAHRLLEHIPSTNIYADNAIDYHKVLKTSVVKLPDIKNKGEVFSKLSSIGLMDGYHLGLKLADENTSDLGDISKFFVYNDSGKEDFDIIKYIKAKPTTLSAWQVYLLMTSYTIMPVVWHGGYEVRRFILQEEDVRYIKQLTHLDLSALSKAGVLLPSVNIDKDESTGKLVAHVFCCYWNEWKGLVRERATIVFTDNRIESFDKEDVFIFYKYDCGILF